MTAIKLRYIHEYRDRTGKLRRYVRRPGFPQVSLPGLPGSPEFMEAYGAATAGTAPQSNTRNAPGSLNAVAIAFYRSTEFANLKPTSQRTYRIVLGPILEKHGHRLVREMPKRQGSQDHRGHRRQATWHGQSHPRGHAAGALILH